jgi:homospermidine synthase
MSKLILFGCGGVGCAFLELLTIAPLKNFSKIFIFDPRNIADDPIINDLGNIIQHIQVEITEKNIFSILTKYVIAKDIIVDISYNIYFKPLIEWCIKNEVLYINTSLERWPILGENHLGDKTQIYERTLFNLHNIVREINAENSSTILLEHGMNPGLISHFTKIAIKKITRQVLDEANRENVGLSELSQFYIQDNYAGMAYILGLETIHCSEKDTQKIKQKTLTDSKQFTNTWGCYSFYAEGVDPIQICLGTHENEHCYPCDKYFPNHVYLPIRGLDMWMKSFVPNHGVISGMLIPHGENETISRFLTLRNKDKIFYCPSQYYVYSPCSEALKSISQVKENNYEMLPVAKSLRGTDIEEGEDAVGALLIFRNHPVQKLVYHKETKPVSYWAGTILSIAETKKNGFKYAGPTVVQVAISLHTAINWMLKNPNQGIIFPESLPSEWVLENCSAWLGKIISDWVDFYPSGTQIENFIK